MKALISGVTGQDGSYLAELLLAKGYEVHGIIGRAMRPNTQRIEHLLSTGSRRRLHLHTSHLSDSVGLVDLIRSVRPDEIYHLAAQSSVSLSFDRPEYTGDVTALGTVRFLEAIRAVDREIRFYQASTSEIFGATSPPQNEASALHPRSPYAVAKLYSHWMTRNYREAYGMYAVNGILFNHESPRRGERFVTRKISLGVARIAEGLQRHFDLGNVAARRDWGYAPEYVDGMWRMLQQDTPDDFVLGTGTSYSVEDFARFAFEAVGLDWRDHVRFDSTNVRPTDIDGMVADPSKAKRHLGWAAVVKAPELARIMVDADLEMVRSWTGSGRPTSGLTSGSA